MTGLFRSLTTGEIKRLIDNGCRCSDWQQVSVKSDVNLDCIRDAEFSGKCFIGKFESQGSGICRAHVRNCEIEDNAAISDINVVLENYRVCEGAEIRGVGSLRFTEDSLAGAGNELEVLIEAGGREVIIHPTLSAQEAYLQAFTRHLPLVKTQLENIAKASAQKHRTKCGIISNHALIYGVGSISNSHFGAGVVVDNASEITGSTINGNVGSASAIRDSIIAVGAEVGVGCLVKKCFIGGGAIIGEGFTAENSLFFANCECHRGEACSIFAGPFTVSHHRSTLLLTALYSFYNAGSGTNFSNHRYKLGPVHQGIFDRGCKSGSSSYLLWPGHIGAFTSVIGKHGVTIDSSELPFSVIIEQEGKSILLPGANIFSAGLERDLIKWHKRDRRPPSSPDIINTAGYNPLTGNMLNIACQTLAGVRDEIHDVEYNGTVIPGGYLKKSRARYHSALNFYYGEVLLRAVESGVLDNALVKPEVFTDYWYDWVGLLLPEYVGQEIMDQLATGKISTSEQLQSTLLVAADNYKRNEWDWFLDKLEFDGDQNKTKGKFQAVIKNWLEAGKLRLEMVVRDAQKEFEPRMQTGFGLIGDAVSDFMATRGDVDDSTFLNRIKSETADARERAAKALQTIEQAF